MVKNYVHLCQKSSISTVFGTKITNLKESGRHSSILTNKNVTSLAALKHLKYTQWLTAQITREK